VDVIDDGVTGVLVNERDTAAHAAACRRLLEDAAERERRAAAGRQQVVDSLTLATMTDRVKRVYA
jgi:glycosyltransferase involved in cell wall biosynthesis